MICACKAWSFCTCRPSSDASRRTQKAWTSTVILEQLWGTWNLNAYELPDSVYCLKGFLFVCLFYFTMLYWFCHTLTWILNGCTCVPHPEPLSHLPPHPIPLGHPSAPALSTLSHVSSLDWQFVSHMIFTCFNAILLYHPALALSHRVQKTVQYICVSFAVCHTGLSLPSF